MKNIKRNTDGKLEVSTDMILISVFLFGVLLPFKEITFFILLLFCWMTLALLQLAEVSFELNRLPITISQNFGLCSLQHTNSLSDFNTQHEVAKNTTPNLPWLDEAFSEIDMDIIKETQPEMITILSYFATSLFDKNNVHEVLWDIVENCIAHLHLEDCVIYMLDKDKTYLIQKAAYGNKNNGEKKIVSPIKIKLGDGIVGTVAKTGKNLRVADLSSYPLYIIDDVQRMSELAVPIYLGEMVIGVLDSEHSKKDFFKENHVFLFNLIAKLTEQKLKQICNNTSTCNISEDNIYFKKLEVLMRESKIYRDPNLGLTSVANQLKISGNYLSQLVNKLTGKNFADYINTFRVEDAKLKLTHMDFTNYTIVGIGLESGFNSKSTFYSAFKKIVGSSPSIYRKSA